MSGRAMASSLHSATATAARISRLPSLVSASTKRTLVARSPPLPSNTFRLFSLSSRWQALAVVQQQEQETEPNLDPGAPMPKPQNETQQLGVPFSSLKGAVSYDTLKAITVKPYRYSHMSSVQEAVLPLTPQLAQPYNPDPPAQGEERPPRPDLLVKAKTGTGKTLAFLVPAIEARLNAIEAWGKKVVRDAGLTSEKHMAGQARRTFSREHAGTLIISPTRELATQIANDALRLTHHHKDFEVRLFVGGTSKRQQMRDWIKGRRDIVVATPGRLRDLLQAEPTVAHGISKVQTLILDEADTLLDMGFRDDLDAIINALPPKPERQTFLFSATVSRGVRQIANSYLSPNHKFIDCVPEDDSPVHSHVPQYHTVLPSAADQMPHILRLIAHDQLTRPGASKVILFLPTTKMTQLFATFVRELSKTTLPAGPKTRVYEIHSQRTQDSRTAQSDAFRADKTGASVLVTSDVSARGVDYPGVTRVIQVGIPQGTDQYIHRVGRTGRAGSQGRGDLVLLPWEVGFVTWQLREVKLLPVTTNQLRDEVKALAEKHDQDPDAFWKGIDAAQLDKPKYDFKGRSMSNCPTMYRAPYMPALEDMSTTFKDLLSQLDEDAIKETFASLLGYYIAKSAELRVQRGVILEGCRSWTTDGLGLAQPPFVSNSFLLRLGIEDGRTKRFGTSFSGRDGREGRVRAPGSSPSWMGRGAQRTKGRPASDGPRWAKDLDDTRIPGDPRGRPEDYRGTRYNKY